MRPDPFRSGITPKREPNPSLMRNFFLAEVRTFSKERGWGLPLLVGFNIDRDILIGCVKLRNFSETLAIKVC